MSFIKRPDNLRTGGGSMEELLNYKKDRNVNPLFASDKIRSIVVGSSGCGKTTLILSNILHKGMLDWTKVMICAPEATLNHPSYQLFKERIDEYQEKHEEALEEMEYPGDICEMRDVTDINQIPTVEDIPNDQHTVIIFDDFMNVPNKNLARINDIVAYGSKRNISVFFLVQHLKIPALTRTRSSADSYILFEGLPKSAWEEAAQSFPELTKDDMYNITMELTRRKSMRDPGTGSPYVIFLKNAKNGEKFLFDGDEYYLPISYQQNNIKNNINSKINTGGSLSNQVSTNGQQSRVLCFKNFEQWDSLITNHILENRIGNESTEPYINGLWELGEQLGFSSRCELKPNTRSKIKYPALYIKDEAEWYTNLDKYHSNPMVHNSLMNFGLRNKWTTKEAVKESASQLLSSL